MRQYEVTFVIDPVLPKNEIQDKANVYIDFLKGKECKIVNIDELGLRQLAYPIKRRNSGVYYCVEFQNDYGAAIDEMELEMRRDEQLLRFLTVSLDKFGVKYNQDKRDGKIGTVKKKNTDDKDGKDKKDSRGRGGNNKGSNGAAKSAAPKAAAKPAAPAKDAKAAPAPEAKAESSVAAAAPAAAAATPATPAAADTSADATAKDDLKKVEGVGPKIEQLMNEAGIMTYAQMAAAGAGKMKEILTAAGTRFNRHDPTTWGDQAKMAAEGKWDELKKWQDEMDGGKATSSDEEE